jgi:hypothetical protein
MSLSMGQQLLLSSPIKENVFAFMRCCHGGAKQVAGGIALAMASIAPMKPPAINPPMISMGQLWGTQDSWLPRLNTLVGLLFVGGKGYFSNICSNIHSLER